MARAQAQRRGSLKIKFRFVRSLRPTDAFLKAMKLQYGKNELKYVLEGVEGEEIVCVTSVFLLRSDTKLVVSDIDGTITKSDVLGQLMPMMGRDWTHDNITELFSNIAKNGYQMVYLTSRAIGQSTLTKSYLNSLKQGKHNLPEGPLIMSPDRLYHSFKREVILKKPEIFKIAALRDLKSLFEIDNPKPIVAAFGNRDTVNSNLFLGRYLLQSDRHQQVSNIHHQSRK